MGALITMVVIGLSFGIGVFILMLEMGDGSPRKTAASDDYEGYKPMPFREDGNHINPAESLYVIGSWEKYNPNYSPYIGKNDE